ncbi:hypothetical protein LL946_00675 [Knoellia locipacati]|uniref:hypothetical protein n=1 Tax=Knoellia locipacati TaxID=882824 RepID=UPI00384AA455
MSETSQSTDPATIDALSDAARASGGALGAQTALWRAMFGLEKWFFVARGTPPEVGPLVGLVDEVPSLLAFTTGTRAREFALANGLDEEQASRVLSVPSSGILDLCDQLAQHGVRRLVVDQGTLGFFAPLDQLRPIHGFIQEHPPEG